jgi:sugar-specific transcriptional regulator TrmB
MTKKEVNDESIKTLMQLGLNFCQARIYLALVQSGESPVKTISQNSGVDRTEIYRQMPSLLKLGLAEKMLDIPIKFRAKPLQEGLNILLKKENEEHLELQKKAKKMAYKFKENNQKKQKLESQFSVIPGKDAHIKWLKKNWEESQNSSEGIITWKDYIALTLTFFCDEVIKKSANKGIKNRSIIYVSEKEKAEYENNKKLVNNYPNMQMKIVFDPPLVLGGVFDSEQMVISTTSNNPIQTGETVFWSSNPSLVALFQNYFETLWKKAQEHNNKEK